MNPMALPIGFPSGSSKGRSAANDNEPGVAGLGFVPAAAAAVWKRNQSSC